MLTSMLKERFLLKLFQSVEFSDDIALKSVTIVPKEVTVSGRKQQVNTVSKVVMKVNVAGQTKNFSAVKYF